VIHTHVSTEPLTRREKLELRRDAMRHIVRVAGRVCDGHIEAAVEAANALHLRTAYRLTREAWRVWQACYAAEQAAREAERELAAMEAS
jgi:hypothetical protein